MGSIRQTPPEPLAPIPFQIPAAFQTKLPNGLRIVIFNDDRLPLVSYRLAFLSGDAHDPEGAHGLTSAMVALMTEGTEEHSSRELAEKIERLGASLNVSSSDDFTIASASALKAYSAEVLDLLAEVVFQPTFPEDELDLYRRNTLEHLKFQRSQPGFLANEQVARILYGTHPYSTISPSPAFIETIDRESLAALHSSRIVANNAVFIVVGDVDRDELLLRIEHHFGDWPAGEPLELDAPQPPSQTERSITLVDRPGSAQANIVIANLAVDRSTPDYFPLLVMNQVLGAGASSRVFMNLREEKGYTYGAYTRLDLKKLAGDFEATAEVRTAVTGESVKEFFYELERIRTERVPDEELADAKNFLTGVFPLRAETQEGLTGLIVNQQLYGLSPDHLQVYRENVSRVTADDVQRVAEKYVHPDTASIVIVGDATEILPQVESYTSNIEVFDTEKNQLSVDDLRSQPDGEAADISGTWLLSLDFQGQAVPVTLRLAQDGSSLSGSLETMLGSGTISSGTVDGGRFSATAVTEMQGQDLELSIAGKVKGDELSGTITVPIMPDPLTFSGKREAAAEAGS